VIAQIAPGMIDGATPLHEAALQGHAGVVSYTLNPKPYILPSTAFLI